MKSKYFTQFLLNTNYKVTLINTIIFIGRNLSILTFLN